MSPYHKNAESSIKKMIKRGPGEVSLNGVKLSEGKHEKFYKDVDTDSMFRF